MSEERAIARLLVELDHAEVHEFVALLRLKGLSKRTVLGYLHTLQALVAHAGRDRCPPSELSAADLRGCVAGWQARGLKASTVAGRVMAIRRFYGFLLAEGTIDADPSRRLPIPQLPKPLPKALTIEETRRLLATLGEDTPRALRDKAVITLLYACGLRAGEAVSIRREWLDLEQGTLRVIGKGDRERRVFLKPQLVALLRHYLAGLPPGEFLFPSRSGKPRAPSWLAERLKGYVRLAGLPLHVSPHTLRHSCATHYLLGGAPITFVQGLLGHASLRTTGRYTGLVDEAARRIACDTPLAVGVGPGARDGGVRESVSGYGRWAFAEAAWQVESVLAWLGDDVPGG